MSDEKVVAKHAGKMADALVQAIRALREKVDTSVLKAAISRGDLKAALAAADVTKLWRDAYEQVMVDSLTQAAVGVLSRKHEAALSEAAPAGVEAHKRSARAKDTSFIDRWVEDHAGEEVARTSKLEAQTIKDAIRRVMADDGFDADDAAEMIKQTIGLTPQQSASLEKYREELLDEGDDDEPAYSQAEIKALLAERSDEMLAQRADTIAFNETQRAMSASQMQAWETLEEDGVIDEEWQKEWVVTSGERACDVCAPMEGLQVGIKEEFSDGISMPPDPHIGCECMVILIDPADIEQNAEARARAEAHGDKPRHPFRGNQYTTGEGGVGEDDAELTDVSVSGNSRYVRANEDATAPQQLGVIHRGHKLADHASMDDLPPGKATAILQHMKTKFGLTPDIIEARFENQLELAKTTPCKDDPSITNWEAGLPFYDEARAHVTALAKETGEPDTQVAGIYSAISPGGVWEDEKATVEFFIKAKGMKVALSARETKAMFELVGEKGLGNLTKGRDHDEVYERGMTIDQLYDYNPTMAAYAMKAMAGRAIDRVIPVGRSYDAFADGLALALGKGSPDQILGGVKTRSFYNNIMDPANSEDVTCDSHMAKCALDNIAKNPADKMYSFVSSGKREKAGVVAKTVVFGAHPVMSDIVRKLAEKHGITPPQAQAIIWTQWRNTHSRSDARAATKAMNERIANKNKVVAPNLGRSIKATKHAESKRIAVVVEREERLIPEWLDEFFMAEPEDEDAILVRVAREKHGESVGHPFRGNQWTAGEGEGGSQVSFEAQPSTATALLRGLHDAPMEMKHAYLRDAVKAIDVNEIAKSVGLKGAAIERAGFYDDPKVGPVSSPSIQFLIHDDDGSDDTKEKIAAFAASVGYLLRQDSVGYHRPVHEDKLPACNASEITLAEPVTPEILKSVDAAMRAHGEDSFALVSSEKGFRVLNFGSNDGTAFNRNVKAAVEAGTPDTITFEQRAFKSDGDLISNDWSKDHNGQGYISRNRAAGRPDVQRAVARANGRLEVVNRRWEALLKTYKRGEQHEAGDEDRDEVEAHGDLPGHEFRGNQWTGGKGGAASMAKKDDKPDDALPGAVLAKTSDWKLAATSAFKVTVDKPVVDEEKLANVPRAVLPVVEAIIKEPVAPPGADQNHPEQQALAYAPDVTEDKNGDGVADFAVVGVPAYSAPPPPMIARLPNLNWNERIVEAEVCERVEKDIDGAIEKYNALRTTKGENGKFRAGNDDPKYFGTDDAKHVFDVWHGSTQEVRGTGMSEQEALEKGVAPELQERVFQRRAEYNTVIHQAANAVAKRAFLKELDRIATLPKEQRSVLVTAGGCAAGKGYVLEKDKDGNPRVPEVYSLVSKAAAVWDSAGDQNGTENPWVASECAKRGIEASFVYVHTDAMNAAEKSISRALKVGRQVDGRVLGDSYEYGAKNFEAFAKQHKGGKVYYVDNNTEKPFLMDELPKTRRYKSEEIRKYAEGLLTFTSEKIAKALGKVPRDARDRAKARLVRALTSGRRIFAGG